MNGRSPPGGRVAGRTGADRENGSPGGRVDGRTGGRTPVLRRSPVPGRSRRTGKSRRFSRPPVLPFSFQAAAGVRPGWKAGCSTAEQGVPHFVPALTLRLSRSHVLRFSAAPPSPAGHLDTGKSYRFSRPPVLRFSRSHVLLPGCRGGSSGVESRVFDGRAGGPSLRSGSDAAPLPFSGRPVLSVPTGSTAGVMRNDGSRRQTGINPRPLPQPWTSSRSPSSRT